jgi:hypothetical protein
MKTILRSEIFRILLTVLALAGAMLAPVALGQVNNTNLSNYIILKLKDHRTLEGPVLKENDEQITIVSQFGNGTITRNDTIKKSDIETVSYLTEGERLQHLAPWAYRTLDKYQLDPQNSYPLTYYNNVINEYFKPFLEKYAGTTEASKLTSRLADWQAERDKVAADQAKLHGKWMTASEAKTLAEKEHTQQILERAKTFIAQGQYQAATDTLSPCFAVIQPPELAQESRRLQSEIYHLWIGGLDAQQQVLTKDVEATKDRITRATEDQVRAAGAFTQARNALINSDRRTLGDDATVSQAGNDLLRAQKELADSQSHQATAKQDLDYTTRTLANVRHDADVFTAAFPIIESVKEPIKETAAPQAIMKTNPPSKPAPPPPPPPAPPPPPSVLQEIAEWFGKNWILVAGALLLALWGISRLFTRT